MVEDKGKFSTGKDGLSISMKKFKLLEWEHFPRPLGGL